MPGKLRKIGIWIDHRQAVIVAVEDDAIEVETVESGLEHVEIGREPRPSHSGLWTLNSRLFLPTDTRLHGQTDP